MKGFKRFLYLIAVAATVLGILVGCGGEPQKVVHVTSYVATDTRTTPGSTAEVVTMVAESVVEIRTESVTTQWGMQYVVSGAGSGVIVAHDEDYETILHCHKQSRYRGGAADKGVAAFGRRGLFRNACGGRRGG